MPIWDRNCPYCNRPLRVDTQSSWLHCEYCGKKFRTDDFLYHGTEPQKKSNKNSDQSSQSIWSALLGSSSKKDNSSKKSDSIPDLSGCAFAFLGMLIVPLVVLTVLII